MSLAAQLLPLLQCQACGGEFALKEMPRPAQGRAEFGTLACACFEYPVVDGVPIIQRTEIGMFEHTTGATQVRSATPAELVRLINTGRSGEALMLCLMPGPRRRIQKLAQWRARRELRRLLDERDRRPARSVLRYFFEKDPLPVGTGHYFVHRFALPRSLAALATAATLPGDARPVIDLACGVGHLDHYLTQRTRPVPVVGLDMNFFHAWIARHWIAPAANYVCCNVADGLPLRSDAFSAVIVSDAYHYLPARDRLNDELERVAPGRMMIFTRVGNRDVMPNEGAENSLQGYLDEIGPRRSVQVHSEEQLVRDYLARRNPLARPEEPRDVLQRSKWLTFVCNVTAQAAALRPTDEPYPHSVGRLQINPIYQRQRSGDAAQLRFQFPAPWFAYENHQMLEYQPRQYVVTASDERLLAEGKGSASLEEALKQFVVIGFPERY